MSVDHICTRTACPACGAARGAACRTMIKGVDMGWTHDARVIADLFGAPGAYVKCTTGTQLWCTHERCGHVPWSALYAEGAE